MQVQGKGNAGTFTFIMSKVLTSICVQKERRKFMLIDVYISVQEVKGDAEKCC